MILVWIDLIWSSVYLLLNNFCKTKINQNQTASFIKHQIVLKINRLKIYFYLNNSLLSLFYYEITRYTHRSIYTKIPVTKQNKNIPVFRSRWTIDLSWIYDNASNGFQIKSSALIGWYSRERPLVSIDLKTRLSDTCSIKLSMFFFELSFRLDQIKKCSSHMSICQEINILGIGECFEELKNSVGLINF